MENKLLHWLETGYIGKNVIFLDEIDSTNNYAKELLKETPADGTVIIARQQISGRGQQNNTWQSPPGGLYFTCILNAKHNPRLTFLTLACGVACQEAIQKFADINCELKWVNDILIQKKKVGGILVESRSRGENVSLIIGIGININNKTTELPDSMKSEAISLAEVSNRNYDTDKFAAFLCNALEIQYENYKAEKYKLIKSLWLKSSTTFGQKIEFKDNENLQEGIVIDISENAELVVQGFNGIVYNLSSNRDIRIR